MHHATNGGEAWRAWQNNQFQFVISDWIDAGSRWLGILPARPGQAADRLHLRRWALGMNRAAIRVTRNNLAQPARDLGKARGALYETARDSSKAEGVSSRALPGSRPASAIASPTLAA